MHLVMLATKASLVQRHLVSLMELQLPISGLAIQLRAQARMRERTRRSAICKNSLWMEYVLG